MVLLFHIYQPPWQDDKTILEHYHKDYLPLLDIVEKDNLHITLNISGSLLEHLARLGKFDFSDKLEKLVQVGNIELTSSAMYHPILPLIPEIEVIRQIQLNEEVSLKYLPTAWTLSKLKKQGFFLPELAYSKEAANIIKNLGYSYIVIDSSGIHQGEGNESLKIDYSQKLQERELQIDLFVNNRNLEMFSDSEVQQYEYLTIVSDGENQVQNGELAKIQKVVSYKNEVQTLTVKEYLENFQATQIVEVTNSTWQMTNEEKLAGNCFANWDDSQNEVHKQLWQFVSQIRNVVRDNVDDMNYEFVRGELDKAIASCTWWWADGRILGYVPQEIEKGLGVMINVIRSLQSLKLETQLEFEKKYAEISYKIWEKHWTEIKVPTSKRNLQPKSSIDLFFLQYDFAKRLSEIAGTSIVEMLPKWTQIWNYLGCQGTQYNPEDPAWVEFSQSVDIFDRNTFLKAFFDKYSSQDLFPYNFEFGCFSYKTWYDANGIENAKLHFLNNDANDGRGPLHLSKLPLRKMELRKLFRVLKIRHPHCKIVNGESWLYNLENYRALFPVQYLDTAKATDSPHYHASIWWQLQDAKGNLKTSMANEFRSKMSNMETIEDAENIWKYKILKLEGDTKCFYEFYDIS